MSWKNSTVRDGTGRAVAHDSTTDNGKGGTRVVRQEHVGGIIGSGGPGRIIEDKDVYPDGSEYDRRSGRRIN